MTIFFFYFHSNLLAQFQREETQLFVLRVMVGLVILYDHVHPQGAFVKGSNVDVSAFLIIYNFPQYEIQKNISGKKFFFSNSFFLPFLLNN